MEIQAKGLAIYTFGNASAFDPDLGLFAIKPSGVEYGDLSPDMMVVVDLDNKTADGKLRPSSDTKTHSRLYKSFPGIGGVCHTHSSFATAWAQARKSIPVLGTTHADHLPNPVPCTADMSDEMIDGDYEDMTGRVIAETFASLRLDHLHTQMALVASHGPFTWGKSAATAVYNAVILEEIAKMALYTVQINPGHGRIPEKLIEKHFYRKHGAGAYYGQENISSAPKI